MHRFITDMTQAFDKGLQSMALGTPLISAGAFLSHVPPARAVGDAASLNHHQMAVTCRGSVRAVAATRAKTLRQEERCTVAACVSQRAVPPVTICALHGCDRPSPSGFFVGTVPFQRGNDVRGGYRGVTASGMRSEKGRRTIAWRAPLNAKGAFS